MLDSGLVKSRSEIARAEGLTPARVTQVMNLLKLPSEVKDFLTRLKDPKLTLSTNFGHDLETIKSPLYPP
jgi:hypothetical protein